MPQLKEKKKSQCECHVKTVNSNRTVTMDRLSSKGKGDPE